jgi:hypothetical protein
MSIYVLFIYNQQRAASATRSNNRAVTTTAGTDAARGQQQPPVIVGTEAARGSQQSAVRRDMRKDGSGLVARSGQTAEQEMAVREEWQEMDEDEPSEESGSDSSYQGSTDSAKVR